MHACVDELNLIGSPSLTKSRLIMSAVSSPTFEIRFAAESDHLALQKWTDYLADDSVQDAKDAADYACEAVRRWKTYGDKNLAPSSIDACLKQIGQNPTSDTAILIVLEHANWKANDSFLFAYLRRTGFGNLYLEFLAKQPLEFLSRSGPSNILKQGIS